MKNILIIDDDINAINNITSILLDASSYHLSLFKDQPLAAISYAEKEPVDIAFLDIQMPAMNGTELAKKLSKINPNIKIVYITGYSYEKEEILAKSPPNVVTILSKPFSSSELTKVLSSLSILNPSIYLSTFGNFDLLIDGKAISFSSRKSKELLAYLVNQNGKSVTMEEAICALWPDTEINKAKILYRDAVWKLRKSLNEHNLSSLVNFERALLSVNKIIPCDYWEALSNKKSDSYRGEYMNAYEWSLETQYFLNSLLSC